eukprot:COSAG02_NODE_43_length_45989_cov_93.430181_20_plen_199_part_00
MEPSGNSPCFRQLLYPPICFRAPRADQYCMSVLVRGRCRSGLQMMALLRPTCRGRRSCLRPDGPPGGQLCVLTRWHASAGRCGARGGGARELPWQLDVGRPAAAPVSRRRGLAAAKSRCRDARDIWCVLSLSAAVQAAHTCALVQRLVRSLCRRCRCTTRGEPGTHGNRLCVLGRLVDHERSGACGSCAQAIGDEARR